MWRGPLASFPRRAKKCREDSRHGRPGGPRHVRTFGNSFSPAFCEFHRASGGSEEPRRLKPAPLHNRHFGEAKKEPFQYGTRKGASILALRPAVEPLRRSHPSDLFANPAVHPENILQLPYWLSPFFLNSRQPPGPKPDFLQSG